MSFKNKQPRKFLLVLSLICVLVILMAYVMEHFFGILPCQMCLYERHGFMIIGLLSFLSYLFLPNRFYSLALIILGFAFLGEWVLAAYHVAIQQHWVRLPSFCASQDFGSFDTVESLRDQMLSTPFVRCDQVTWRLFGFSLAAYNALLSFMLAITCWMWVGKKR